MGVLLRKHRIANCSCDVNAQNAELQKIVGEMRNICSEVVNFWKVSGEFTTEDTEEHGGREAFESLQSLYPSV
jgi:hypothetical protein